MYYDTYKSPICDIILVGNEDGLAHLHLETKEGKRKFALSKEWVENEGFFVDVKKQLFEYFSGKRKNFDLKLNPQGTDYQKKIWKELQNIPYAELYTYKQIAEKIGNPKASRAVGMANSKNPIPIIIPCHKVVGKNGKLTGFAFGLAVKEKLINLEIINSVFEKLKTYYGDLNWWPAQTDFEMMTGAILTQNTTWKNVEKALANFKGKLSPQFIKNTSEEKLAEIIKPSGYYNQKAKRLKYLCNWFEKYDFDIEKARKKDDESLRTELLEINGVGRETADSILVYALEKTSFVIDAYTRRIFHRIGIDIPETYDELRILIENCIPKDFKIYNEYHGLIVEQAKQFCTKKPQCDNCPIYNLCKKIKDEK